MCSSSAKVEDTVLLQFPLRQYTRTVESFSGITAATGGFFGSSYQQEDSVGDVTAVAFVLRPCIHDDGFLGVRQLPGLLLADLPVGGRCIVPAIFG